MKSDIFHLKSVVYQTPLRTTFALIKENHAKTSVLMHEEVLLVYNIFVYTLLGTYTAVMKWLELILLNASLPRDQTTLCIHTTSRSKKTDQESHM